MFRSFEGLSFVFCFVRVRKKKEHYRKHDSRMTLKNSENNKFESESYKTSAAERQNFKLFQDVERKRTANRVDGRSSSDCAIKFDNLLK
jgi:hypothetical protein